MANNEIEAFLRSRPFLRPTITCTQETASFTRHRQEKSGRHWSLTEHRQRHL